MTNKIRIPAVRASQGAWEYYVSFMPVQVAVDRINTAEEIHGAKAMHDYLQRGISRRRAQIAHYLRVQPQRFFSSLVIATYGGSPKWFEVGLRDDSVLEGELPEYCSGALGILEIDEGTKLFAIDGQHRLVGMREALKEDETLGQDEISALFVHGVSHENREDDVEGYQRTRRLFTHLNRYAQKVSLAESIVLDEDDVIAITTRDLAEFDERLAGRIRIAKQKTIPATDKKAWTSLQSMYEAFDRLFRTGTPLEWRRFKTLRPEEEVIQAYGQQAKEFLDLLEEHFPPVTAAFSSESAASFPGTQRTKDGGHVLFRPLGLDVFSHAARRIMDEGYSMSEAVSALASLEDISWDYSDPLFSGLLWNAETGNMLSGEKPKFLATAFLAFLAKGIVMKKKQHDGLTDKEVMADHVETYIGHTGQDKEDRLPQKILDFLPT